MKANIVILFYNSNSGSGTFAGNLDRVIEKFQEKGMHVFPYKITRNPEPMVEFLNSLDREKVCKVIMSGGDGSVDICINALIYADYHVPVAIFPTGTANDLANHLNIPTVIEAMLDVAVEDYYVPLDIGRINDRYFANEASLGFIIDVSQKTDQKVKNMFGMIGYYLKGLEELPKLKPFKVHLKHDGIESEENIYFMLVMNGNTAGGFKRLAPNASVSDGKFDVIIFKECPVIEFVNLVVGVLKRDHINSPYVDFFQTDEIIIDSEVEVGTDVDGEKGPDFPLHIRQLPGRFNVCTPRAIR